MTILSDENNAIGIGGEKWADGYGVLEREYNDLDKHILMKEV